MSCSDMQGTIVLPPNDQAQSRRNARSALRGVEPKAKPSAAPPGCASSGIFQSKEMFVLAEVRTESLFFRVVIFVRLFHASISLHPIVFIIWRFSERFAQRF